MTTRRHSGRSSRSPNYLTIVCVLSASVDKLTFLYFGDGDGNVLTLRADDRTASELDSQLVDSSNAMESDSTE